MRASVETRTRTAGVPSALKHPVVILAGLLALAPHVVGLIGGYIALLTEMVIFAIFAIGFNLLLGYSGILSFGHAAFFGLAGYVMGLILIHWQVPLLTAMAAGVLVSGATALLIGLLIIRKSGIYFAMLTIAFGQMFFFVASRWRNLTGGEDGLTGIPREVIEFPLGLNLSIADPLRFYYLVAVLCLVMAAAAWKITHSHFGLVLKAIRENEVRTEAVGYDVRRYKLAAFVISALYAAVAGTLYGLFLRYMFPQTLDWVRSGQVVIMTLVGGLGTFFGPIVGAALIVYLNNLISFYTKFWQLMMGLIFVIFVLLFPRGIWGFVERKGR